MNKYRLPLDDRFRKWRASLAVLFFVASISFFSRSYSSHFVSDDYDFLGRISLGTAGQYFSHTLGSGNEYRPLVAYSYALDSALSGMSPTGYHLTSTILHTATALLIGMTVVSCGFPLAFAGVASTLFLFNPVTHQSVLWIAGRPVALSTFFVAFGLWAFVKAATRQSASTWFWVLSHAAFAAALLSYEGAIVFPLLAVLLYLFALNRQHRATIRNLVAYGVLGLVYLVAWNLFFRFKITRFPVETSVIGGFSSFGVCVLHMFHGAHRVAPALLYLGLLGVLCLRSEGRKTIMFGAAWAISAYLPFLLVRGYADRFAYVSSIGAAIVLSACVWAAYERSHRAGLGILFAILCFFGIGMQNRITI